MTDISTPRKENEHIHTSDAETYRPLAEIVADLDAVKRGSREAAKDAKKKRLRVQDSSFRVDGPAARLGF